MYFSSYLSLCCSWTAPEVSEQKFSYASRFYCWFWKIYKSCVLLLVALPDLIDTLAQLPASLKVPAMIVYDVATKVLDTEIFLHHTIVDLNLWYYIYCFAQSEAFTVKVNTRAPARVLINAKLRRNFRKCTWINANQGSSDFAMVWSYCGFHHMQFWMQFFIEKGFEWLVFYWVSKGKTKLSLYQLSYMSYKTYI